MMMGLVVRADRPLRTKWVKAETKTVTILLKDMIGSRVHGRTWNSWPRITG